MPIQCESDGIVVDDVVKIQRDKAKDTATN